MKTYKDFNVKPFKDVIVGMMNESGDEITENSLREVFEKITEPIGEVANVYVCCLTCGIKFPINRLEHDCQDEDIWLYKYIKSSLNKDMPNDFKRKLNKKYPLTKSSEKVFRGINFERKEEYELFMKQLNNGKISFPTFTSWSKVYDQAWSFARFMKKGTRQNEEVRRRAFKEMIENQAFITGYKGIVISTVINENDSICDISEKGIGNLSESEVIVSSGMYSIEIVHEVEQLNGLIPWKMSEEDFERLLLDGEGIN